MATTAVKTLAGGAACNDTLVLGLVGEVLKYGGVGTIAAAGNSQGTGTAITEAVTYVTAADGTKGVTLPTCSAGRFHVVYSTVATNGLPIYPNTSDDINDGTTNAAVTIEGKTLAIFFGMDDTTWGAIYTANS